LREECEEKQRDFRIKHIREDALAKSRGRFRSREARRQMQPAGRTEKSAYTEKNEIRPAKQFQRAKSPGRCGEKSREAESRGHCVHNASDRDAERRSDTRAATLSDTAPENVSCVRSGREIKKNPCRQEEGEMMDTEHESIVAGVSDPGYRRKFRYVTTM